MELAGSTCLERFYRLAPHFHLKLSGRGAQEVGYIYSSFPLLASKTTPRIIELLRRCDGRRSVKEMAHQAKLNPLALLKILEELHARGFLELQENLRLKPDWELPGVTIVVPVYNRPAG